MKALRHEEIQPHFGHSTKTGSNAHSASLAFYCIKGWDLKFGLKNGLPSNFLVDVIVVCQSAHFPSNSLLIVHWILFTFSYSNE